MIINLRGTSGAGKSTIVKMVMEKYTSKEPMYRDGRRQPIFYNLSRNGTALRGLRTLGHYEIACGGCDTIQKIDDVYEMVRKAHAEGYDVLYEGIIVQDDVNRAIQLHKEGFPLVVLGLTTPLKDCLASVQARRDARGDVRPLDPKNTIARAKRVKSRMEKLRLSGVKTEWVSREQALERCLALLGL